MNQGIIDADSLLFCSRSDSWLVDQGDEAEKF